MLGPNDWTLIPVSVEDAAVFPVFSDDVNAASGERRHVVTLTGPVVLVDEWQLVPAVSGSGEPVMVEVRSADCGAGCRCAGEYRVVTTA